MMKIIPKVEVKNIFESLSKLEPDKNRYVRWGIIKLFNSVALAREDKREEVMPFLYDALKDDEWSVRKSTIESFNELLPVYSGMENEVLGKSLSLLTDEDLDIIKELFQLIYKITRTEVKEENLQVLEGQITEKLGAEYTFDVKLLEKAIMKIKEVSKPPKYKFKKSDL